MTEKEKLLAVSTIIDKLEDISCVESQGDVINYERYDTRDDEEKNIPELAELTGNVEIYYQYQDDTTDEVSAYELLILAGRFHKYYQADIYAFLLKTNDYDEANTIVNELNAFCEEFLGKRGEWYVGCPYEEYVLVD